MNRREYTPERPTGQQAQGEDPQLAIDTLERRIAHLSALINPAPGAQQRRTAHWRDEVELRSLRLAVKALRQYRGDDGRLRLLALATRQADQLQQMLDSGALGSVRQQEQVQRMVQDAEDTLEACDE